ncbi:metalloregulator ArsR/SmtB family transcription factor [Thermithiobacillus plumbiphilus]|uniref:Metalloregulator ArsR/SmtB family transcription factor n=1 Tax=Thermithiobacillus plumbiphilus TaxID=1729899 RepID=A0ABU9DD65_9PROT
MEINNAITALGALAQENRLAIFRLLVQAGPTGLPAGQIGEQLGIPPATLSFHLSQLSHAGLLQSSRQGRSIIYVADYAAMNALLGFLTENCCAGQPSCCPPAPVCTTEEPV